MQKNPDETTKPEPTQLTNERIYEAIKELNIIDAKTLEKSLRESTETNTPFDEVLYKNDLIDDVALGKIIGDTLGVPYINLSAVSIAPDLVHLLPEEYARRHKMIAFEQTNDDIKVAMVNPSPSSLVRSFVEQKSGKKMDVYYTTERDFEKSLKVYKQNLQ